MPVSSVVSSHAGPSAQAARGPFGASSRSRQTVAAARPATGRGGFHACGNPNTPHEAPERRITVPRKKSSAHRRTVVTIQPFCEFRAMQGVPANTATIASMTLTPRFRAVAR